MVFGVFLLRRAAYGSHEGQAVTCVPLDLPPGKLHLAGHVTLYPFFDFLIREGKAMVQ